MKIKVLLLILAILCFGNIYSQIIILMPDSTRQTIYANGINFEGYHTSGGNEVIATKFEDMLDELPSQLLRMGIPLKAWEPQNDNDDYDSTGDFNLSEEVENSMVRLQELDSRGYELWATVWDVADWMVSNPEAGYAREINDLDEFAESIVAYLKYVKDNYDVSPKYISINEPSIADENGWGGYQIAMTASQQAEIIKKSSMKLRAEGIATEWVIAVHKFYPSELAYAQEIYSDPEVREYAAAFDYHGWWIQYADINDLANWANWVRETGLLNFCGEVDYDNQFWQRDDKQLWVSHGMETGLVYHIMYTTGESEGGLLWYADKPKPDRPYRYVSKHFMESFSPGRALFDTEMQGVSKLYVTAAKVDSTGEVVVIIQNNSSTARVVDITGFPNAAVEWIETRQDSYYQKIGDFIPKETQRIQLQPHSINTFNGVAITTGDLIDPEELIPDAIEELKGERGNQVQLQLNPNQLLLQFHSPYEGLAEIRLLDLNGRILSSQNSLIHRDTNEVSVNIDNPIKANQLYLVQVNLYAKNGDQNSLVKKVICWQ